MIILCDRLAREGIALIVGVALEGLFDAQLVGAIFQRFDDDRRQRQGHVADPQLDHLFIGVCLDIGVGAGGYLGKKIARHKIVIVAIDFHILTFRKDFDALML